MSVLGALTGYGGPETMAKQASPLGMKPRTLREELQNQMQYHKSKIERIQEALDSLSPDVEKALNALQKLSY